MVSRCFSLLLSLCLSAHAVTVLWKTPGENVTLLCSNDASGFHGMYLYHYTPARKEVLFYHSDSETFHPRPGYETRLVKVGSQRKHNTTILHLSTGDSGTYECVYRRSAEIGVTTNVYALFVSGSQSQCRSPENVPKVFLGEKCPHLLLITVATCAVSVLVTLVCILLLRRVKRWLGKRRTVTVTENVYEIMAKSPGSLSSRPE